MVRSASLAVAAVMTVAVAGCLAPAADGTLMEAAPQALAEAPPEVLRLEWTGHVLTSSGETLSHVRPTEDVLWPVQKQGFLAEVPEGVTELEVALAWEGSGELMIMLHSHKDHGTNVYVEHVTPMDAENPKCLRVPLEDVVPGTWQVMVHSRGAQDVPFTLTVLTVGGAASVLDDLHGHWLQDGRFEIDEREVEACALWGA